MPQRIVRRIKQHPRSGIPHHLPDPFPVGRRIAMDPAQFTGRLLPAETAAIQPPAGKVAQRGTGRTQRLRSPVMRPAIEADHALHHPFFAFNPIHFSPSGRDGFPSLRPFMRQRYAFPHQIRLRRIENRRHRRPMLLPAAKKRRRLNDTSALFRKARRSGRSPAYRRKSSSRYFGSGQI